MESRLQHIKEIIEQEAISDEQCDFIIESFYESKYNDIEDEMEESDLKNEIITQQNSEIDYQLEAQKDVSLSEFLISEYKKSILTDKVAILNTIVNSFSFVFKNNYSQYCGSLCHIEHSLNDNVLIYQYQLFIHFFKKDKDYLNVLNILKKDNPQLIYSLIFHHKTEKYNFDKSIIDILFEESFTDGIPTIDFLKIISDLDMDGYDQSTHEGIQYIVYKYISKLPNKKEELIKYYFLFATNSTEVMRLSSVIGWVLTDIMKQAIEEGWVDKIELFKKIYTVNKKFNNKSITLSCFLYNFIDTRFTQQFYKELYAAIPDNYTIIRENKGSGIYKTIKLLNEIEETKYDPALNILGIIKLGTPKHNFVDYIRKYGVDSFVNKLIVFKKQYPNIYKSTFENKSPVLLSKTKEESIAYFEEVMLKMKFKDINQGKGNKKRL